MPQVADERLRRVLHDGRAVDDVPGACGVVQRAQRLLHVVRGRRAARDHEREAGPAERVHEQLGELAVAVGDVRVLLAVG